MLTDHKWWISEEGRVMATRLEHYRDTYRALTAGLGRLGFISPGSLVTRYTSCYKPGCRCMAEPPRLHGPYHQWSRAMNGKTVSRRLTEAEAEIYAEWIANRRELKRVIAEMEEVSGKAGKILLRQVGN